MITNPHPIRGGGNDPHPCILWTCGPHTHLAAGQGGLYHPVSICVSYIHHPSIQISHFPMADLFLSGHNWASAPTPARGRELRRPGATDISMCFILFHDIFNYINYT